MLRHSIGFGGSKKNQRPELSADIQYRPRISIEKIERWFQNKLKKQLIFIKVIIIF